jgi:hypothetical protein
MSIERLLHLYYTLPAGSRLAILVAAISALLVLLPKAWRKLRAWRRGKADESAALCPHGKYRWRHCSECAAAFVLGVEAERLEGKRSRPEPPPGPPAERFIRQLTPPETEGLGAAGAGRQVIGALTRALKELAPDQCVQIDEQAYYGRGVLFVRVANVGQWEAPEAIDILGMCRAKLRLPGRSAAELEEDLSRHRRSLAW